MVIFVDLFISVYIFFVIFGLGAYIIVRKYHRKLNLIIILIHMIHSFYKQKRKILFGILIAYI